MKAKQGKCKAISSCQSVEFQPDRFPRHLFLYAAAVVICWGIGAAQHSYAQEKIALVIGNANYLTSPLANPVNDARDMKTTLTELGFRVIFRENVGHQKMEEAVDKFAGSLKPGDVGLFFYAGHGVQVGGQNYLLPVAHGIQSENEVKYKSMNAAQILGAMEQAGNRLNVIIIDACRDNPFKGSFRSASRGLARVEGPLGSIVAYATAPGNTAEDGSGKNGVYTKHLLNAMQTPGLTIEDVFKQVRNGVMSETGGRQVPWEESSLLENFYFQGGGSETSVSPEYLEWQVLQHSEEPEDIAAFIEKYPAGSFTVYATNRLRRLESLTSSIESSERNDWENLGDSPSAFELKNFIRKYPDGKYAPAARILMDQASARTADKKTVKTESVKKPDSNAGANRNFPELISVPAGCANDGCAEGFGLGRHEVTVAQFGRFVDDTGYISDAEDGANGRQGCVGYSNGKMGWQAQWSWRFPGFPQTPDEPVVCLSLADITEYLDWLGSKKGTGYRLPTNLEWSVAARGGEKSNTFWRRQISNACQYANIADNNTFAADYFSCNDRHAYTAPVGTFQPNEYGAYDMLGNVWEWTSTSSGADSSKMVSRGGSWVNGPKKVGFSGSASVPAYIRTNYLGFRVARAPE